MASDEPLGDDEIVNYETIMDTLRLTLAHRSWLTVREREKILDEIGDALGNHSEDVLLGCDIRERDSMAGEGVHVVSTSRDRVFLLDADGPDEAEERVREELDINHEDESPWLYYEGTLDQNLESVRIDGISVMNP